VSDEARNEPSDTQSRTKGRRRMLNVGQLSIDLGGQYSGLPIERVESVHLLHLVQPDRSASFPTTHSAVGASVRARSIAQGMSRTGNVPVALRDAELHDCGVYGPYLYKRRPYPMC
jgi:hypothetical protein